MQVDSNSWAPDPLIPSTAADSFVHCAMLCKVAGSPTSLEACSFESVGRVGHAYAEYAVHADFAHMREYAYGDENLIHIIDI